MIDTDDLDRLLRDELTSAAELHAPPSDPAGRVATHVRRRRRRRAALRVSVAASVTVLAVVAFAFTRPTDTTAPAHRPSVPAPSVLSTPQVAADRFARTLLGDRQVPIDWASVRLLEQQGQARVFGARDTHGVLCAVLVVPDSKGQLSAGADCGSNGTLTARAAAAHFAAHGAANFQYGDGTYAIGFFVPDNVRSAAVDGVPVPVVRNGLLLTFDAAKMPKRVTLSSAKGTVTITFSRDSDGLPSPTVSGAFE